jgi:hypothetical protein
LRADGRSASLWCDTYTDVGTNVQGEEWGLQGGIDIGFKGWRDSELFPRVLPLRPIWPGFAINTLFYAAILWLLFFAPGMVRRRLRIRRDLCLKCAYPRGTSECCTECGTRFG